MPAGRADTILRHLRQLVRSEAARGQTDAELLHHFACDHDTAAFAALMQRHSRLVLGVCRHVLHHEQDAEDAFQATFLVLARRAGSIRKPQSIASWLHGVAHRIALKARRSADRRREREQRAAKALQEAPPPDLSWRDLQAILDEEVGRLPEKFRAPFVLCCLEGKSRSGVAREL